MTTDPSPKGYPRPLSDGEAEILAPFHTPVFVLTHETREPWERPGGTTFQFVNDGIETALDQAREAAGDRDVRIAGGGATILECSPGAAAVSTSWKAMTFRARAPYRGH